MLSSISSSERTRAADRIPAQRWAGIWLLIVLFAAGLVGGAEAFWRSRGHLPSVAESGELWAYHRARVYGDNTVVLLGQSRMHLDFSTETFRNRFPRHRVVQLAINGHPPIATLRDLANDERFNGLIICSLSAQGLRAISHDAQQKFLDAYHELTPLAEIKMRVDRISIALLQSALVVVNPRLNLKNTLLRLLRGQSVESPYFETMLFDRSVLADYSKVDLVEYRRRCTEEWPNPLPVLGSAERPLPTVWLDEASVVQPIVEKLRRRGGRVVFVHFPATDELLELHEELFPRQRYWDRFAAIAPAPVIHFQDVPTLAHFECPDMSHLDQRDTPRFTAALLDEIVRLGLIGPESH